MKGSTAIAGRSGRAGAACVCPGSRPGSNAAAAVFVATSPTKRKALAGHGADQRLARAVIADRLAGRVDPAGQGGLGDEASVPNLVDQLVLADDPVTIFHEVDDEVENLRLHGNGNLLAAQLTPIGVEKVVPEHKLHVEISGLTTKSRK